MTVVDNVPVSFAVSRRYNTAEGAYALFHTNTGSLNTGLGINAGSSLTTGNGTDQEYLPLRRVWPGSLR